MKGIFWLASYPKSGNTWLRIFFTNLHGENNVPADINKLDPILLASSRSIFDKVTGVSSANLTQDEIDDLRPAVYEQLAAQAEAPIFMKVHDAFTNLPGGRTIFSTKVTLGALYIIRNPLDVVVSYANHTSESIDQIISTMTNKHCVLCGDKHKLHRQLRQKLKSWGEHANSWLEAPSIRTHLLRYEDMLLNPVPTFQAAARFVGLPDAEEDVRKAVRFSEFKHLKAQECLNGFKEKPPLSGSFFFRGRTGSWREHLTGKQVNTIIKHLGPSMRHFGYLKNNNDPVF